MACTPIEIKKRFGESAWPNNYTAGLEILTLGSFKFLSDQVHVDGFVS